MKIDPSSIGCGVEPQYQWRGMQRRRAGFIARFGALEERGRTEAEAVINVMQGALTVVTVIGTPVVVHASTYLPTTVECPLWAMVFCDLYGWNYKIYDTQKPPADGYIHGTSGFDTVHAATDAARYNMATWGWSQTAVSEEWLPLVPPHMQDDFRHWLGFQEEYQRLRAEGKTDQEAHRLAAGLP